VPPLPVVEDLDVLENRRPSLLVRGEVGLVDPLHLQAAEETLRHVVVPAVALATHAALDASGLQQLLGVLAGVLTAPVRVVQQPVRRLPALERHVECVEGQEPSMRSLIAQPTTRRE